MADDGLEKQHQATGRRLEELKRKGQTMRSKDLSSGMVFMASLGMLFFMADYFKIRLQNNFTAIFGEIKNVLHYEDVPIGFLQSIAVSNFLHLLPIYLIAILAAYFSPFIFGGWNFSSEAVRFKWESLDPISNLKNMFSKKMLINVFKSTLKVSIILSVLFTFGYNNRHAIFNLSNLPLETAFYQAYIIVTHFVMIVVAALIFIILGDVLISYFEYQHKIKMTTQELKDELKDTEGNAQVKRKIRSAQIAILRQRLGVTVPSAHVIVTNPTHYAVAIKYDSDKDKAPKIVAKGKGLIAQHIRKIAVANIIPIYEAPLLARALYNTTKIGAEIHPELYMGVALVLSYVNQFKKFQHGQGQMPTPVTDLPIPEEFIYHE